MTTKTEQTTQAFEELNQQFTEAKEESKQTRALNRANYMLAKIDALSAKDAAFKTEIEAKRAAFAKQVEAHTATYNAHAKKPYSYDSAAASGDADGLILEYKASTDQTAYAKWCSDIGGWADEAEGAKKKEEAAKTKTETKTLTAEEQKKKDDDDAAEKKKIEAEAKGDGKHWWDDFPVGKTVGGVAGAGIGYLIGNMFGGGAIGKIVGWLFTAVGALFGAQMLGDKIDGMLHRTPGDAANKVAGGPNINHQQQPTGPGGPANSTTPQTFRGEGYAGYLKEEAFLNGQAAVGYQPTSYQGDVSPQLLPQHRHRRFLGI